MTTLLIYGGLFWAAFLAATILPAQSEALLAGLLAAQSESWALLIATATLGNILGAVVNWALGRAAERLQHKNWFPLTPERLVKATAIYNRFGRWCLLFSWLPIVGDALTVVAGVLREKLWIFVALVGIGKLLRYLVVAAAVAGLV